MALQRALTFAAASAAAHAASLVQLPAYVNCTVSITDYGAVGDNFTVNTGAFAAAIAAAAAARSRLLAHTDAGNEDALATPAFACVPPGVFVTGTVNLTSNVYLALSTGAIVQGSHNPADYSWDWDYWHIVQGLNVSNAGLVGYDNVTGEVTDGSTNAAVGALVGIMWQTVDHYDTATQMYVAAPWQGLHGCVGECRVKNLAFIDSSNVTVAGVALLYSSDWTSLYRRCTAVTIAALRIAGSRSWPNGDGMDVESGADVTITRVNISTGDDCIALRSGNCNALRTPWPQPWGHISPLTRVRISNVTLASSSSAIKIEGLFQLDHGNVTSVSISDVTIVDSNRGIGIWQRIGSGVIANISVANVRAETHFMWGAPWWGSGEPLVVTSIPENANQSRFGLAGIHNVSVVNLSARSTNGALFSSRDQGNTNPAALTALALTNVSVTIVAHDAATQNVFAQRDYRPMDADAATPNTIPANVTGMYFEHVTQATLTNCSVAFVPPAEPYWTHVCLDGTSDSNVTRTGAWSCQP